MASNLKVLKGILKVRNKEVFGRVETSKEEALRRLAFWDDLEKEKELFREEVEESKRRGRTVRIGLTWKVDMEEVSWRQKS